MATANKKKKLSRKSYKRLLSVYSMEEESLSRIKRRARAHRRNMRILLSRSNALDDIEPLRIWGKC